MNEQIKRMLQKTSTCDFDGHTEFSRLTPDQRLSWLDEANAAFLELHALANPALRIAEDEAPYGTE